MLRVCADPFSAVRASLRRQLNDELDDGVTDGRQAWLRRWSTGFYRPVHVKTLRSQKLRMLLTHRKLLQSKAIAIENDLRGTLRNFGLKSKGMRRCSNASPWPRAGSDRGPLRPQ